MACQDIALESRGKLLGHRDDVGFRSECRFGDVLMFVNDCVADSCCSCLGDVYAKTAVVLHQCAKAESGIRPCVPSLTVVRFDMGFDCASEGGKWIFHVVVVAVDVCVC